MNERKGKKEGKGKRLKKVSEALQSSLKKLFLVDSRHSRDLFRHQLYSNFIKLFLFCLLLESEKKSSFQFHFNSSKHKFLDVQ